MSTARKHSEMNHGPIHKQVHQIMDQLDQLLIKLSKSKDCPSLQQGIDQCAKDLLGIIQKNHASIAKFESYLKNAIIDLTEVPHMQTQMQKIAFEVAIRAAITNLKSFLENAII